jgi:hypothetical protein
MGYAQCTVTSQYNMHSFFIEDQQRQILTAFNPFNRVSRAPFLVSVQAQVQPPGSAAQQDLKIALETRNKSCGQVKWLCFAGVQTKVFVSLSQEQRIKSTET